MHIHALITHSHYANNLLSCLVGLSVYFCFYLNTHALRKEMKCLVFIFDSWVLSEVDLKCLLHLFPFECGYRIGDWKYHGDGLLSSRGFSVSWIWQFYSVSLKIFSSAPKFFGFILHGWYPIPGSWIYLFILFVWTIVIIFLFKFNSWKCINLIGLHIYCCFYLLIQFFGIYYSLCMLIF